MKKNTQKQQDTNQMNKKELIFNIIIIIFLIYTLTTMLIMKVSASTINNNTSVSENTYINHLIDMSVNQDKDIETKKYMIIQVDYDYYLITFKDYTINGNRITANNTTIYKAIRTQSSSYNYVYNYSKTQETQTIVNNNYLIYSNIDIPNAMENNRYSEYQTRENIKKAFIFIIAFIFVIMLMKGRK